MARLPLSLRLNGKNQISFIVLAVVGFASVMTSVSRHGAGLWPDATKYIDVARSMLAGQGYHLHHAVPGPLVHWPPLFPALLTVTSWITGVDPLWVAPVLNAFIFGLTIYCTGFLVSRHFVTLASLAPLVAAAALVSRPLFGVSTLAASEPLFNLLVVLALFAAMDYVAQGGLPRLLALSSAIALATLTRYVGIVLFPVGLLAIGILRRTDLKTKTRHLLLFSIVAGTPLGAWLLRNHMLAGSLMGERGGSMFSLVQNLEFTANILLGWYMPLRLAKFHAFIGLLGVAACSGAYLGARKGLFKSSLPAMGLAIAFVAVYLAFMILTATTTAFDRLDSRLLSPVYIPLTILLLMLAQGVFQGLSGAIGVRKTHMTLVACICGWLAYQAVAEMSSVRQNVAQGVFGYGTKEWEQSETIGFLARHPVKGSSRVYSNDPDALYILANLNAVWSPLKKLYNSDQVTGDASRLKGDWPGDETAYLVWFHAGNRQFLFTPEELQAVAAMKPIARLPDGVIYSVSRITSALPTPRPR